MMGPLTLWAYLGKLVLFLTGERKTLNAKYKLRKNPISTRRFHRDKDLPRIFAYSGCYKTFSGFVRDSRPPKCRVTFNIGMGVPMFRKASLKKKHCCSLKKANLRKRQRQRHHEAFYRKITKRLAYFQII